MSISENETIDRPIIDHYGDARQTFDTTDHDGNPARGIALGVALSVPIWALIGGFIWRVFL